MARVSPATVSLVLNNKPTVKKETCQRIRAIIKSTNYKPNMIARTLVKRRSASVVLLVNGIMNQLNPEIAASIERVTRKKGYSLFIVTTLDSVEVEREEIEMALARGVDGIITASVLITSDRVLELAEDGFPVVFVLRHPYARSGYDYVVIDNVKGGYLAAEHLIRLGNKRIGVIKGRMNTSTGIERFEGALKAFADYAIPPRDALIRNGDYTIASGYQSAAALFRLHKKERPTAIFACNDDMAIGALDSALEHGLRVPEDLAIVGFNNQQTTALKQIQVTTVSQETQRMGHLGITRLLQKIERKKGHTKLFQVVLEPKLLIRRSCGFYACNGYRVEECKQKSIDQKDLHRGRPAA